MSEVQVERPRNLDWPRASALLYGDWGTSKAYVIGLAFVAAGFGSFPIILAVCALTLLVGLNYMIVCRCFPDGGGVYSAAREQSRALAVVGALLLVADLTVTAALSGWAALRYLGVPGEYVAGATIACILAVGVLNYFGPRHSGSLAVMFAVPTVIVVITLILLAAPDFTLSRLEVVHESPGEFWVAFVNVILALSGVEAIANLTGTMRPDKGSKPGHPKVGRNAFKAILPVALEVSFGTALLGLAMLSLPHDLKSQMLAHSEDMLRFIGEHYATALAGEAVGQVFGWIVGIVFALLLLSAVNTAIAALVGLLFMVARDGEMPRSFTRLNRHGVPLAPLGIAVGLPILILIVTDNFQTLAGLYAIGVVGAISVNLGSSTLNRKLEIRWFERALLGMTATILIAIEFTLAQTKHEALFFVACVLVVGLALRAWALRRSGLKSVIVPTSVADLLQPHAFENVGRSSIESPRLLVCMRGFSPVLGFAIEEAKMRGGSLYIMYVREMALLYPATGVPRIRWQDDPHASAVLQTAINAAQDQGVSAYPIFAATHAPSQMIVDTACTLGIDFVILGASRQGAVARWLRGSMVRDVLEQLPDSIELVIHG